MAILRPFGAGALAARAALAWIRSDPRAADLERTNFHGRTVTLAGGPALAAGATLGAALGSRGAAGAAAAVTAGAVSGVVGFYDDVVGNRPEQKAAKGFRGHLGALREGRVTSGLVKIAGVGAAALAASALLDRDRRGRAAAGVPASAADALVGAADVLVKGGRGRRGTVDVLLGAGVIAGTANLLNLLDLRPGRAIKAAAVIGAPLTLGRGGGVAAGTLGAGAALLPADLGEEIMLGDAGANALGALLGVALAARTGTTGRAVALAVLAGLTAASERVSFTKVIQDTPWLRRADELGRRPPSA
jgi:UDP-N-acetylmuramyl pentapeptide phosphotransferase/UDP-N-acetylglucosamine-1-phosphate transferase